MNKQIQRKVLISFASTQIPLAIVLIYWHTAESWLSLWDLSLIGSVTLALLNLVIFFLGQKALALGKSGWLTNLILASFLIKFILVIGCVSAYFVLRSPTHPYWVLPFLTIYIVNAGWNTWSLQQLK